MLHNLGGLRWPAPSCAHGVSDISAVVIPNTMPDDPSEIGFSASLPLEIAMGEAPVKEICLSHGVGKSDWDRLRVDPHFIQALEEAHTMLQQEGAMFKAKIRAQAEGVLARNWQLIHSSTELVPANVQAELIRFTIRAAGLDASVEQKARANALVSSNQNNLQINLILGDN